MTAVTVCVPVYNAESFVVETLKHIAAQTFADFKVVISVDQSTDASLDLCQAFASTSQFCCIAQQARLGWVGNVNALIQQVDTPYFCIVPHDDLLHARYLETMFDTLMQHPSASCAYSDIEGFGNDTTICRQPDVLGNRMERVVDVLLNHYSAVAFRGLVRRRDANDFPLLRVGMLRDFAADTVWLVSLAVRGELRRVPEVLYRKRYVATSVHAQWSRRTRHEELQLFGSMVAGCTLVALDAVENDDERDEVLTAGLLRAAGYGRAEGWGTPKTPEEIATVVAAYTAATTLAGTWPDLSAVINRTQLPALQQALVNRGPELQPPFVTRVLAKARSLL